MRFQKFCFSVQLLECLSESRGRLYFSVADSRYGKVALIRLAVIFGGLSDFTCFYR